MQLVSWNIQWGRGVDGHVDLGRIVNEARRVADFDILCLQEVTRGFHAGEAEGGLPGGPSKDQFQELASLLPGFSVIGAIGADLPAVTAGAGRCQFGNAIATRLPVGAVLRHSLPWPADPAQTSMPRVALEAEIHTDAGLLRVITTHLEFYSETQRLAQIQALRRIHAEACDQAAHPAEAQRSYGPFTGTGRPSRAIVCGDFNSACDSRTYRDMLAPMSGGAPSFADAWRVAHPDAPRAPTVGLYDREQWADGPLAFDFIFITDDLAPHVARCEVDAVSAASDHQPVLLELR